MAAVRKSPGRFPLVARQAVAFLYLHRHVRGDYGASRASTGGEDLEGGWVRSSSILPFSEESFSQGCLSPSKLHRINLVDQGEKRLWCVELVNICGDDLVEIFDFFGYG